MDERFLERYLLLGLRLGKQVDGIVDAYYGPAELARQGAEGGLTPPSALAGEASSMRRELEGDSSPRAQWLAAQLDGLAAVAERLDGRTVSYTEEVRRCYGIEAKAANVDEFEAAHKAVAALLPGSGPVRDRYQRWQSQNTVPVDKLLLAIRAVNDVLRERTRAVYGLPDGEAIEVDLVSNEPWAAFNYYQGGLRSRVVVNTDVPIRAHPMASTAAHESYPGHHTEHAWKETLLVRGEGRLEESIQLIGAPQCVISEGVATNALEALGDGAEEICESALADVGVGYEVALARAVREAVGPLDRVTTNAALMLYEGGADVTEIRDFCRRWRLDTDERIAKNIEFMLHPVWRTYTVIYAVAEDLVRSWTRGDSTRFKRLLTEQLTPADLVQ